MEFYKIINPEYKVWMMLKKSERDEFKRVLAMKGAEWDVLGLDGDLNYSLATETTPIYYKGSVYVCRVDEIEYAKNQEDWNGRYAASVPRSFASWCKSVDNKVCYKDYRLTSLEFVRLNGNEGVFLVKDEDEEFTLALDNNFYEGIPNVIPPQQKFRPYKDDSEFPPILEFKCKKNSATVHLNYDPEVKKFWGHSIDGKSFELTHEELYDLYLRRDGTPAGVKL